MFLSDFSVKRPTAMVVLIIALMGLGLLALSKLRVNNLPDVEPPVLVVNVTYPGASPETVEREIVNRIEKSMQSISGVDRLSSTAREGSAQFVLIFDFEKNLIEAADEVRNAIAAVRYKLPTEMREPILQRVDPTAQPVMQLALSSSVLDHAEISRMAEDQLADRFRALPGVAVVNVNGALRRELSVLLHAEKLRQYSVSVTEVVTAPDAIEAEIVKLERKLASLKAAKSLVDVAVNGKPKILLLGFDALSGLNWDMSVINNEACGAAKLKGMKAYKAKTSKFCLKVVKEV
jgi:HAE1 family hydrophobic/amphiphilic exporter-1